MTTGERIRYYRNALGYSQKKLGELCGIAEPTIRRYELGKLNPKPQTLKKISDGLGLNSWRLLLDEDSYLGNDPDDLDYIDRKKRIAFLLGELSAFSGDKDANKAFDVIVSAIASLDAEYMQAIKDSVETLLLEKGLPLIGVGESYEDGRKTAEWALGLKEPPAGDDAPPEDLPY